MAEANRTPHDTDTEARPERVAPPSVTVIVPAYKAEAYIADCIRSVQAQRERNWRLIIVDDGSPDKTGEIASRFASEDPRITVIRRDSNGGMSAARNTGLRKPPETPYVTFLDADDVLHPDYLTELLKLQEGRSDRISSVPLFHFPATSTLGKGTETETERFISAHAPKAKGHRPDALYFTPDEAVREILYQREMDNSACGKLYPSHLVPCGIFTEGTGYEDLDAFYRIFREAKDVAYMPLALYGYRDNPQSYIHTFKARRADVLDVGEKMERYMAQENPGLLPAARSRLLSAYFNILALATTAEGDYDPLIRRAMVGIRRLRREALCDRNVRMKNKAAILASYIGGRGLLQLLARLSPEY